ncbi:hypothetical protein [Paraburkholderia unamae]|uniref:Uncharacterized protein n=1 Tax=Paraburkholderia unamae TaxID=219649 RepID=A0ACC6RHV0_9BURK
MNPTKGYAKRYASPLVPLDIEQVIKEMQRAYLRSMIALKESGDAPADIDKLIADATARVME